MSEPKVISDMIAGLIEDHAPTETEVTVKLPRGDMRFRVLSDAVLHEEISASGKAWIKTHIDLHKRNKLPAVWVEVFTTNATVLAKCYFLSRLALDEGNQSVLSWLTLARKARVVFDHIYTEVMTSAVVDVSEAQEFADEKKDSSPTSG